MTAFALGRMRHLDLLALYFTLRTGDHGPGGDLTARLSKEHLVMAILGGVR